VPVPASVRLFEAVIVPVTVTEGVVVVEPVLVVVREGVDEAVPMPETGA